jgi:hypothetical protein
MQLTPDQQAASAPAAASVLGRAPLVVTAFAVFCVLATLAEVLLLLAYHYLPEAASSLSGRIVPFVGWVPAMPYMFALYWALRLRWRPSRPAHLTALGMLALGAALGVIDFLGHLGRANYGNPMLTVSPWRPLWTVVVPLLWLGLLLTPQALRFRRGGSIVTVQLATGA